MDVAPNCVPVVGIGLEGYDLGYVETACAPGCTVAQHASHNPKNVGSNPATGTGRERENSETFNVQT